MATNTGKGSRTGSVSGRSQVKSPVSGDYTKRNDSTGRFMQQKEGGTPFKGVAKEPDGRRGK